MFFLLANLLANVLNPPSNSFRAFAISISPAPISIVKFYFLNNVNNEEIIPTRQTELNTKKHSNKKVNLLTVLLGQIKPIRLYFLVHPFFTQPIPIAPQITAPSFHSFLLLITHNFRKNHARIMQSRYCHPTSYLGNKQVKYSAL